MFGTGLNSGTTFSSDASVGTIVWSNPSNAATRNFLGASTLNGGVSAVTQYLFAKGFGFSIPTNATIDGIIVNIYGVGDNQMGSYPTEYPLDSNVRLLVGGVVSGTNKASAVAWVGNNEQKIYGSKTDLWGNTLTPADINSAEFGVATSITLPAPAFVNTTMNIDYITIQVFYTLSYSSAWLTA